MANKTDIMRLLLKGVSQGDIARRLHCSKTTVSECARVLHEQQFTAEVLEELGETTIRQDFFTRPERRSDSGYNEPDYEAVCKRLESNRKLTLKEIWYQYSSKDPEGKKIYSYSQFCKNLRSWSKRSDVPQKMRFVPGQVCFFDWALPVSTEKAHYQYI
jgi:transcriptional regulator with XRE-family HTH domain